MEKKNRIGDAAATMASGLWWCAIMILKGAQIRRAMILYRFREGCYAEIRGIDLCLYSD